jgi:hypothetical protein
VIEVHQGGRFLMERIGVRVSGWGHGGRDEDGPFVLLGQNPVDRAVRADRNRRKERVAALASAASQPGSEAPFNWRSMRFSR